MRQTTFLKAILTGAAFCTPAVAMAAPDCGNPPIKTAEVVYKIQTPQQALAPQLETIESARTENQNVARTTQQASDLIMTDSKPSAIKTAEVKTSESATAITNYEAVLTRRISRGDAGLNLFDYAGAKSAGEGKIVKAYTDYLAAQNPDELPEAEQIAYWANLYNALTVNLILDNYPVKSIRKIKAGAFSLGPWKRDEVTVNGKVLSLDDIEHKILRKRYANPAMVHYMVNCASIGCPNLPSKLWVGETLEEDRAAAAREFINSPRGVSINGNELKVSSIYDWFKEDFGGSKSSTLDHFKKFAGPDLKAALKAGAKIDKYDYNWDLNE